MALVIRLRTIAHDNYSMQYVYPNFIRLANAYLLVLRNRAEILYSTPTSKALEITCLSVGTQLVKKIRNRSNHMLIRRSPPPSKLPENPFRQLKSGCEYTRRTANAVCGKIGEKSS